MNADVYWSLPIDNWIVILKLGVGEDEAEDEFPQHLAATTLNTASGVLGGCFSAIRHCSCPSGRNSPLTATASFFEVNITINNILHPRERTTKRCFLTLFLS